MRGGDLAGVFPFLFCLGVFCVSCCLLHHLFFALVGAAVLRFGLFAAGFVMRCLVFCLERIGASDAGF